MAIMATTAATSCHQRLITRPPRGGEAAETADIRNPPFEK